MADLHSTRRGILGTMAALPALTLPAIPLLASTGEWGRAVLTYKRASAAHEQAAINFGEPEGRFYKQRTGDSALDAELRRNLGLDRLEAAVEQKLDDLEAAEDALIRMPAPHIAAVIEKLELVAKWQVTDKDLSFVVADLRRLIAH